MEMSKLLIEFVFRKKQMEYIPPDIRHMFDSYEQYETDDRLIYNVPDDWVGFRDGTIVQIYKRCGEAVYVALSYFTMDVDEIVTDFDGNPIDKYEVIIDGRKMFKYVKKRIRILKVFDKETETFQVKAYVLNTKYVNPIIKVLDVYSVGKEGGLSISLFREQK